MKRIYDIWLSILMAIPRLIGFLCGVSAVGYQIGTKMAYKGIKEIGR